jgi:phosphoribosylformylglycinamidine cyclo-ligase
MSTTTNAQLNYAEAGVNIDHGNQLVKRIKTLAGKTQKHGVIGGIGGFGGLFDISACNYKNPVLVSGTDGVGTKLKIAIEANRHENIGIDLVAMCVNDLLVLGAEPLFFLDYYATAQLQLDTAETVIEGIVKGCKLADCALLGGETAEMPGLYRQGDYDLAGFCVGIVEKDRIIDGSHIRAGDHLIAVASSGAHSNGYSLIRKIINDSEASLSQTFGERTLLDVLLEPTRIYVKPILGLLSEFTVNGIVHITGGGLTENLPRILPDDVSLTIDTSSWQWPELFSWLKKAGNISETEMYTVFNCGIGMVLAVNSSESSAIIDYLNKHDERAWLLGEVKNSDYNSESRVTFD